MVDHRVRRVADLTARAVDPPAEVRLLLLESARAAESHASRETAESAYGGRAEGDVGTAGVLITRPLGDAAWLVAEVEGAERRVQRRREPRGRRNKEL